jgi:hypothetical protein
VLFRMVFSLGRQPIRVMVRVASMIGTWELCDGLFEKVVIYLAPGMWRLSHIVQLVPIVARVAGVNNRVL